MYLEPSSLGFARLFDDNDPLARLRQEYHLPLREAAAHSAWPSDKAAPKPSSSKPALYLCGNSLGPMAKRTHQYVSEELDAWATHSVLGHFNHPKGSDRQWTQMEQTPQRIMSDIVGAKPSEVALNNTLTSNLHTLLATFYRPLAVPQGVGSSGNANGKMRHKIIHERSPFPSDQYTLTSIAQLNNLDPEQTLVPLFPRTGEDTLRTEDILSTMEREAATGECWGILLGSVQYLTGQAFELGKIAAKAHELGIFVAYDLAHAFANVPLALHDWGVDFAAWCTYKYGSSGPGGIGGMFVHEKWHDKALQRPAGWWGHNKATRFAMPKEFDPMRGAAGWQQSNPSALDVAALRGSLETLALSLDLAGNAQGGFASEAWQKERDGQATIGYGSIMPVLRAKSLKLTGYMEHLLFEVPENKAVFQKVGIKLVSPADPEHRGSQLTIRVPNAAANGSSQSNGNTDDSPAAAPAVAGPTAKGTLVSRVQAHAEEHFGLIADIRNPDVIRLAPLAQYSTFEDVWRAVQALKESVEAVSGA